MSAQHTVLLLGGTGRTGRRVLEQLLSRGVNIRVIVRSAHGLPPVAARDPGLTVVDADLLSLGDDEILRQVHDCDAVISCLGHAVGLKGILGPPHDLVTQAATKACRAIEALQPAEPVKLILMSSVSVNRRGGLDRRRGRFEKALLWMLRGIMPPARDNQRAADFLYDSFAMTSPFVRWVAVRPDTLREDNVSEYTLHEGLVMSAAGKPKPLVAERIPLLEAARAHQLLERGGHAGKVVLVASA